MIAVLRSEWIKVRTVRMNLVLAILSVAFPVVVTGLTAALIKVEDMRSENLVSLVTGTSVITGLLLGVIGVAGITSEFGFGTIRPTFAATPKRFRVMIAKAIITVLIGMVVQTLVVAFSFLLGSTILNSRDGNISLDDAGGDARAAMLGIIMFAAIVSLLGFGLGLVIRSTPAAVAVLILWPLVAEGLIGALLSAAGVDNAFKWLPYNAGIALGNPGSNGGESLGRIQGGLYFFAVTAALTFVGALFTDRRDA